MKKELFENIKRALLGAGCLTVLGALIFMPVLVYWFAYFGGWILAQFVGDSIVTGFNTLFNREVVSINTIPVICGCLAVIGRYFKSTQTNTNNK